MQTLTISCLNKLCDGLEKAKVTQKWLDRNFSRDEVALILTRFPLVNLGLKIFKQYNVTDEERKEFLEVVKKQIGNYDPVRDKIDW